MRTTSLRACLLGAFLAGSAAVPSLAHDGKPHAATDGGMTITQPPSAEDQRARAYFSDTELLTHDGEVVRFYSDVLRGKTVVITFFYADCPDACPLINQVLADVQEALGDQFGSDVRFVTITTDPETDTPEKLAKYRKGFGARDGWYFLTGSKENIQTVSKKLGQMFEREQHLTMFLAGNVTAARWRKIKPNTPVGALVEQLRDLVKASPGRASVN